MHNIFLEESLTVDDVLLVPQFGVLNSRSDAELYPFIYSAPMDTVTGYELSKELNRLGHIPCVSRALQEDWAKCFSLAEEDKLVFFAVGPNDGSMHKLLNILTNKPNLKVAVAIDIAHGHSIVGRQMTRMLRELPQVVEIMSGSICTAEAAVDCLSWGCTHLRCGVGPGSLCSTRLMTKCGMGNITAVHKIYNAIQGYRGTLDSPIHLIADGGIRYPGDAVAYLTAGADGVMLGRAFSECEESAGWIDRSFPEKHHEEPLAQPLPTSQRVKHYRGQASKDFQLANGKAGKYVEGVTGPEIIPNGTAADIVNEFEAGVRSAISYLGLTKLSDLKPENVEFIRQTTSGYIEGTPHGLNSSCGR